MICNFCSSEPHLVYTKAYWQYLSGNLLKICASIYVFTYTGILYVFSAVLSDYEILPLFWAKFCPKHLNLGSLDSCLAMGHKICRQIIDISQWSFSCRGGRNLPCTELLKAPVEVQLDKTNNCQQIIVLKEKNSGFSLGIFYIWIIKRMTHRCIGSTSYS